jgi:predicted O-linked N-acetylglucosamine transferase (SPINDLY family)
MRRRLAAGFDEFLDVQSCSDRDIAALLHDRQIDIAVDLKGYTQDSRPEILAFRPAPIQLNYLGYPGTMGADFIDYIIADEVVLPLDQQHVYAEKIVHLPGCYQVNDRKRTIGDGAPTRADVGLPPQSFVFCCFNNNYKITRPVFAIWMRLLQNVPGSVLWLLRDNAGAERNLRQAATANGIDAERLVFAERKPLDAHLARHGLADLALDTLPYNAHTTASDALWAGVPMVTCEGRAFAGRVGSSVLRAIGLPELVTANLGDYESLAQRLAADGPTLAAIRAKLRQNRAVQPLFDADRFRTRLEAAYLTMWETWQRGDSPRAFRIE